MGGSKNREIAETAIMSSAQADSGLVGHRTSQDCAFACPGLLHAALRANLPSPMAVVEPGVSTQNANILANSSESSSASKLKFQVSPAPGGRRIIQRVKLGREGALRLS